MIAITFTHQKNIHRNNNSDRKKENERFSNVSRLYASHRVSLSHIIIMEHDCRCSIYFVVRCSIIFLWAIFFRIWFVIRCKRICLQSPSASDDGGGLGYSSLYHFCRYWNFHFCQCVKCKWFDFVVQVSELLHTMYAVYVHAWERKVNTQRTHTHTHTYISILYT